jgi:hypothetical protein
VDFDEIADELYALAPPECTPTARPAPPCPVAVPHSQDFMCLMNMSHAVPPLKSVSG